ncbi:MAG: TldD/PmbA family protein [Euryarchaeota archaeon]|nr:TldD/PmbA family protein [Euryarchaeota archaeon]
MGNPEKIIANVISSGAEYVDIRIFRGTRTSLEIQEQKIKEILTGFEHGAGIRVLFNGSWGFASTSDLSKLDSVAETALKLAKSTSKVSKRESFKLASIRAKKDSFVLKVEKDPKDISIERKKQLLIDVDTAARAFPEVVSVRAKYAEGVGTAALFTSEGTSIETELTKTIVVIEAIARRNNNLQFGYETVGASAGFEAVENASVLGRIAAQKAVELLGAEHCPAGKFPIIMDPKLTGVFIHEALGHAAEGDNILQKNSVLEGKLGTKIGSKYVTVIDDPTIKNSFGFYPYDDEGVNARKNIIVKDGILTSYLHSRETASKLKSESTGNARAEGYHAKPIVRMSNTYIEPGNWTFEEMIEDINLGVYVKGLRGGQVDPAKGLFQFAAECGYLIEKGKLTKTLRNIAFSGETLNILERVDAVGKDFQLSPGMCGKLGQLAATGDGGPHVRVSEALVGGLG